MSTIARQERLECADKTRRLVDHAWAERVFYSHTDEHVAYCGNSSRNANGACSPRGAINFVAEVFSHFTAIVRGAAGRCPRL